MRWRANPKSNLVVESQIIQWTDLNHLTKSQIQLAPQISYLLETELKSNLKCVIFVLNTTHFVHWSFTTSKAQWYVYSRWMITVSYCYTVSQTLSTELHAKQQCFNSHSLLPLVVVSDHSCNFPRCNYFSNRITKFANRIAVFQIKYLRLKSNRRKWFKSRIKSHSRLGFARHCISVLQVQLNCPLS